MTTERTYMVLEPLKTFVDALPSPAFCRIHRAYLIGLFHVTKFDRKNVYVGDEQLTIGDIYMPVLPATAPVFQPSRQQRQATQGLD